MAVLPLTLLLLAPADGEAARTALSPLNELVGEWRGVGQPKRGRRAGAWRETAAILWDFDPAPHVLLEVADGKEIDTVTLRAGRFGRVTATVTPTGGGPFVLTAPGLADATMFEPPGDGDTRLTLRRLSPDRFTLLLERRRTPAGRFRRVAEVGYTRAGVRLAERSLGGPECVVTGGLGTIPVTHAGETYHVCCTGCVTAFDADPAGVLAAYRGRKAAAKAGDGGRN